MLVGWGLRISEIEFNATLIRIPSVSNSAHCCVWQRGRKRGDGVVSSTVGRKKEIVN